MNVEITNIDICVCTFRRPQVADTLKTLARLKTDPRWQLRVIIADNDETPSARPLIEKTASEAGLTFTYLHAPARNISIARNACLAAASAPFIAFIDDDELATPDWLNALVATQQETKADVVLGPVHPLYASGTAAWIRNGEYHAIKPVWVNGEITTGYTSNVLLRNADPVHGMRFLPELGQTGGEDTIFFAAIHRAGGKIAYAPNAVVNEPVAPQRARLGWLMKRYFRYGQTHGLLLLERQGDAPLTCAKNIAMASAKALFCLFVIVPNLAKAERAGYWLLRGIMHMGVVARLLGKRELTQYG